jgi:putative tRNA adenosine deaminase-associated protein
VLAVAYFAALLARSADRWQARDADLDEIEDVAGLVEFMREVPDEEEDEPDTVVLLLEQEDVWFAVVRLDAEEDPRLFVSDVAAVSRSAYADLLLAGGLVPPVRAERGAGAWRGGGRGRGGRR